MNQSNLSINFLPARYNLEEIHIDGDLTSDSASPRRTKKQWRTSIDDGFGFGSSWLKFAEANGMTPGDIALYLLTTKNYESIV